MTAWVLGNLDKKGVIPRGIKPSTGPSVDFTDIVRSAYDEQTRNWSLFGLRVDMADKYQEVREQAKAEGKTLPGISRFEMDAVADNIVNNTPLPDRIPEGRNYWDLSEEDRAKPLRQRVAEFNNASPVKMSDILAGVQAQAARTEMNTRDVMRRAGTVSGVVGSLAGGAGGIMNVERDPVNFFTLGMGGVGKSFGARVAGEAGINMSVEAGNMALGALKNRQLLGLETTPEQIATQLALTGAASAGLRGLGELPNVYIRRKKAKRLNLVKKANRAVANVEIEAAAGRAARGSPRVAQVKTEQGVTARLEEPIRVELDEAGRANREVLNEEIYQDFRLIETQQRILFSERQQTPLRIRQTTEADFTFKARALDQAFMDGVFGRPDKTFAEAMAEIKVASPIDGETIAPFRFLSDTLASAAEAERAVQEAHPHLFTEQARLETKIEKLEARIDAATAKSERAKGNIVEISRLEKEIAKLSDAIERGEYPKGRKRKLVEQDIADKQARIAELSPQRGSSIARKKLGKLNRELAAVEDEIQRLNEGSWLRRVPEAQVKERARRLTGDPILSENFASTAAGRIEFSKQLDTFLDQYEKVKDSNVDAMAEDLKKSALDEGLEKITLGDLEDIPMDMEWLDVDMKTKSVRQMIKEAGDDELAAAMKACAI